MPTRYCENPYCENEATKQVPVSEERAGDSARWLCAVCEEVFTWGVQHGERAGQGHRDTVETQPRTVLVGVYGGLVQWVRKDDPGIRVIVRDYDTDGCDERELAELHQDADGQRYNEWEE